MHGKQTISTSSVAPPIADQQLNDARQFAPCVLSSKGKLSGSVTPAIRSNFGETGLSASKLATRRAV